MDNKIIEAYEEYKKLPKATINGENKHAEIYDKGWSVNMGRAFCHPNPHRHYTLLEFAYYMGKYKGLRERFWGTDE